jgi:hypothetical protein
MAGPYVVAISLLVYVFYRVPLTTMWTQLRLYGGWELVPVVFGCVWLAFLLDCLAIWKTVSWSTCPIGFREVLNIRGATYLLAAVNYHLGQGGFVYFLHKEKNLDLARAFGVTLLLMGAEFVTLVTPAAIGVWSSGQAQMAALRPYLAVAAGLFLLYLIVVAAKPGWLTRFRVLEPALNSGVGGNFKAILIRFPHMAVIFGVHWAALAIFGVRLPLAEGLACLAAVFFVVVLPISVQGLGTGQVAAVVLLSAYAPGGEGQVLAYSLSVWALGVLTQVIIGLVFARKGLRMLRSQPGRGQREGP